MKCTWSDGEAVMIELGQQWANKDEGDLEITGIKNDHVTFVQNGKEDRQKIKGTDGFIDYLETCGFLKL